MTLVIILIASIIFSITKIIKIQTLQKKLQTINKELNILRQYYKATKESNIISKNDTQAVITYVNDMFCNIIKYTQAEMIGKRCDLLESGNEEAIIKNMQATVIKGKMWKGVLKNKKKDGTIIYVDVTVSPIFDENGEVFEVITIRHDITDLVLKTQELGRILDEDYLTKIGSRHKLIEDIASGKNLSIALMNINNFSAINDFFGYKIGDTILKLVAKKIKVLLLKDSRYEVYRLNSDIFAILAQDVDRQEFIDFVTRIDQVLSTKLFSTQGREIYLQFSYCFSFEAKNKLLETANAIQKYSKTDKSKKIYNKNLNIEKDYEKNIFWVQKIKQALERDGIIPYFQAIYNMHTNKIEKYETLMRLKDGDKIVSPMFFLNIAKKSGQYLQLTKKIVEKSFEYFKDKDCKFSINLTFEDIANKSVSKFIINKIEEYNIGHKLIIEIVEQEEIDDFPIVNNFFEEIRKLGCQIAIDDFGSGYSNFRYLIKLNADYIKIDGSLIKDILIDKNNENIISTIISFAKVQNVKVVAEYVFNEEIFKKVKELGVDYVQGYYIKEPEANIDKEACGS